MSHVSFPRFCKAQFISGKEQSIEIKRWDFSNSEVVPDENGDASRGQSCQS
jgi:hypothetical protein